MLSAATMILGADSSGPRQTLAFSLSVALHLTFALIIFLIASREIVQPPIEISIFDGPKGPASPPPGEKSAAPGPVGPPPEVAKPVEAPKAPPAPKVKAVQRPRTIPKPEPVARPVEEQGLLAALKKTGPAPTTQAFEGVQSSVALRKAPSDGATATGSTLGTARSKADVSVGAVTASGPQVSGSLGSGVGSVVLPGPGGGGSGWNSGGGGTGSGGGGNGRGGFSVSGAGAGGAGRSYASIWEWTQRYLAGLRWAYNNELRNNAGLRGVIVVRYEILGNGAVGQVTMVSSQLRDPGLEQQVLTQIRGWHYPPEPTGTVVVTWPFSFLPPS